MTKSIIVVDNLSKWSGFYPSDLVVSFDDYLSIDNQSLKQIQRVINLCNTKKYLGSGYYCSLLAEARKHRVIPSVNAINDLNTRELYRVQVASIGDIRLKAPEGKNPDIFQFYVFFGETKHEELRSFARRLFERINVPILEVTLIYNGENWEFKKLKSVDLGDLEDGVQTEFANVLESFSQELWRKPQLSKAYRWELAMLVNPEESLPPSNKGAIQRFIKAGKKLQINVEPIRRVNSNRIGEFDALFIRETTEINHHTYRLSRRAELDGLVVIDDPQSILRCCNKVYLTDAFERSRVPSLKSLIIRQSDKNVVQTIEASFQYPCILKVPNGSFSRGVVKVETRSQLKDVLKTLFHESALVLAQEYFYTEYDWRIGVLNHRPLFANRYYMVKDHWQIYNHGKGKTKSGGFDSMPTFEVPKPVLDAAVKACSVIGNGLYGVDLKQDGDRAFVIEVNDNPSIDSGVEDRYLGEQLYLQIMEEFVRRLEHRGR